MRSQAILKTENKSIAVAAPLFDKDAGVLPISASGGSQELSQGVYHNFDKIKVHSDEKFTRNRVRIQAKLQVNQPDDEYEREADAMAERVMRMPDSFLSQSRHSTPVASMLQRKCARCEEEEEKQQIQRKESRLGVPEVSSELQNYVSSFGNSGSPLSRQDRDFFEPRLGFDFSKVRVHTDAAAAKSAQSVNALAYTSGNNIVFNNGQYLPDEESGKKLLGHELIHVIQQSENPRLQRVVQRQIIRLNAGRDVGNSASATSNLKEDVLEAMDSLHVLWSLNDADYAAEYPVVSALPAMSQVPVATIPRTIGAITNNEQPVLHNLVALNVFGINISNTVGRGMANTKADIAVLQDFFHGHWLLTNANFTSESAAASSGPDPVPDASIPQTLAALTVMKTAKVAEGFRTHDVMRGTHAVSAGQRAQVEAALIPGATSSGGVVTVPTPDAICSTVPALETEIRANIVSYVHTTAANFTARRASPPVLPIPQMNSMADVVQDELQSYFGSYLSGATHTAASKYTPGSYTVRSQLRDQSTTVQWQTTPGRKSWVNYWISTRLGNSHHCNQADIDTVADHIATDPAVIPDIDITVQSWPAEATNGININPFIRDAGAGPDEIRRGRWDAFTTIMHEAIHHLAHPNFVATYEQMRNDSMQILKEGFNDMFRHELWFSPGNLVTRIADASYASKRRVIEGAVFPYNAGVVYYHPEYPQITPATTIRGVIGNNNAKAAYFLGHTELLGLGAGSQGLSGTGSYAGTAMFNTSDRREENIVNTVAGESYAALLYRVNATAGTVTDAANGNPVAPGGALPARVRVAGVRHVTAIPGDTLNSIAFQNGVTPFAIVRANNLASLAITPGQRLLIPVH